MISRPGILNNIKTTISTNVSKAAANVASVVKPLVSKPSKPAVTYDWDGMPFCLQHAIDADANVLFQPALDQALPNLWTPPTPEQIAIMEKLLDAFYDSYKLKEANSKVFRFMKRNTKTMMACADALGLQCCRAKVKPGVKENPNNTNVDGDSYLLFYTKSGITNYNGPFLMLREKPASNVIIVSPHDDFDGTSNDTKQAFKESRAMCMISNGHHKWYKEVDFSKTANTLGSYTLKKLAKLMLQDQRKPVILNIHGMKDDTCVMYRSRSPELSKVFEEAILKYTTITRFEKFNAEYDIDSIPTPYQLKTEMPAIMHRLQRQVMGQIVNLIETNSWAWGRVPKKVV